MDVNVDVAHLIGIKLSATQLNLVTTDLRARILSERTVPLAATDPVTVTGIITQAVKEETRADPSICAIGSAWPARCRHAREL